MKGMEGARRNTVCIYIIQSTATYRYQTIYDDNYRFGHKSDRTDSGNYAFWEFTAKSTHSHYQAKLFIIFIF